MMQKQQGSVVIRLVILLSLAALFGVYWGYQKYQAHQHMQQQHVQQLMAQQQQIVLAQRAVHGNLPDEIKVQPTERQALVERTPIQTQPLSARKEFKCDGREHCSQMRSYEEAAFFNQYCPNTKMDGDQDGIPCEQQFKRGI